MINSHLLCQLSYWGMTGARILRRGPPGVNRLRPPGRRTIVQREAGRAQAAEADILGVVSPPLGESPARRRFAALIARPSVPLAEAALAIAEEEYPGLDTGLYLAKLDALGCEVEGRMSLRRDAAATLREI